MPKSGYSASSLSGIVGIYTVELIILSIMLIFTVFSAVRSTVNYSDPLTKRKISTRCPCCHSQNIRFQPIQVCHGKPSAIAPMVTFISCYVFGIIDVLIFLFVPGGTATAFFGALFGGQGIENVADALVTVCMLGYATKIMFLLGTVLWAVCMLMPNETESQLAKICMDCGAVSDANSDPEQPSQTNTEEPKEPLWSDPAQKNR